MKFISTLILAILFIPFANVAVAKEKSIKFYQPETEADRGPSAIFKLDRGLIKT